MGYIVGSFGAAVIRNKIRFGHVMRWGEDLVWTVQGLRVESSWVRSRHELID